MVELQQDTVVQMRDSKKMIDERKTGLLNQVERLGRSTRYGTGGYAAYIFSLLNRCWIFVWQADFCIFYHVLLPDAEWRCLLFDFLNDKQTSAFFILFIYCTTNVLLDTAWRWLTLPEPKHILVIVLSVLCGWVPLYWYTYLLMSVIDCTRRPNRLMHAWACGVAVADWYVGNAVLVALELVRLLSSSSDSLRSEESDHINVLG